MYDAQKIAIAIGIRLAAIHCKIVPGPTATVQPAIAAQAITALKTARGLGAMATLRLICDEGLEASGHCRARLRRKETRLDAEMAAP